MSSEKLVELNADNFADTIKEGVTLIDFWAPWCGPCLMQTPILEKVADAIGDKATIAKVNVDEAGALAAQFGVRSIPTLIIFKYGEVVKQSVGVQQEDALVAELEAAAG
jgi:thioredoxin 1